MVPLLSVSKNVGVLPLSACQLSDWNGNNSRWAACCITRTAVCCPASCHRPTFEYVLAALEGRCADNSSSNGDCSSCHEASSRRQRQQEQQEQLLLHRVQHYLEHRPQQALAAARTSNPAPPAAAAAAAAPPTPVMSAGTPQGRVTAAGGCTPGLSWSEVSYGGGQHKGFF